MFTFAVVGFACQYQRIALLLLLLTKYWLKWRLIKLLQWHFT